MVVIPDEPREEFFCGCNAVSAVSQAVCEAAATVNQEQLYRHISHLRYCEVRGIHLVMSSHVYSIVNNC